MGPAYKKAASNLEPRIRLAKLNTEDEQTIGARYDIRSIPTLALFRGGKEVATGAGSENMTLLNRLGDYGPVFFGIGFVAPLIAQSMDAATLSAPLGLSNIALGLVVGGSCAKKRPSRRREASCTR